MKRSKPLYKAAEWAYDSALGGLPGSESARQMGEEYLASPGSLREQVDRLIRWQVFKSGAAGFASGVAGGSALPIVLPAAMTTVLYVQLRMVAAIAHMGGHDIESDRVRALAYACLCGNAAKEVVKDAGIVLGTRLTHEAVAHASAQVLRRVQRGASSRLLARFASTGATALGRVVPLVGGGIGATFDGATTYAVGRVARQVFIAA